MKHILLLIFVLLSKATISQNQILHIEYEMKLNFGDYQTYSCNLYTDNNNSFFTYKLLPGAAEDDNVNGYDEDYYFTLVDTNHYFINTTEDSIFELKKGFDNHLFYIVKEDKLKIKWKIINETKLIDKHKCQKAIGRFRGRNYTAWFTLEYPSYSGPWKFHGLPGCILKIFDDTQEVVFTAKKINRVNEYPKNTFGNYDTINRKTYKDLMSNSIKSIESEIATKMERGFTAIVTEVKIKSIEIDED